MCSIFGFMTKFKTMPKQTMRECASKLQNALTNLKLSKDSNGDMIAEKETDVSCTMLREELQSYKSVLPDEFQDTINPEKLLKYLNESNLVFYREHCQIV